MSESDRRKEAQAAKERRDKLVKAGVTVGIGSAALVAALLYASTIQKKRK
jgi:hypothetical protein